ncbi:MAG TPA: hypothetical protein VFL51_11730, partial [Pseudolabrys sp.]|nr:hypothetical protein [Pseudolabrys sp.]
MSPSYRSQCPRPQKAVHTDFFSNLLVLIGIGGITLLAPTLQLHSRLILPAGLTFGFFGGILGGIAAMAGPL